ncbi:MAG: hypothetical protein Q8O67_34010 [Deltaproteobacteria bacterium]|nr:hypothetical protein [Deltaproteobacteria bacterium]
MSTRTKTGFKSRPADFSIGSYFVWASQGWSCLMRVDAPKGEKVSAVVVRSNGVVDFVPKPSTSTRAIVDTAEATRLLERLAQRPVTVSDRDERLKSALRAQKALDPFVKVEVLLELALLREQGEGFWSDDKVSYARLKEQLVDEIAASLRLTVDAVESRFAAHGIP